MLSQSTLLTFIRLENANFKEKNIVMKRILALFIVLLFVVSCGGGSGDSTSTQIPENSPDFEEIEIPTSFMREGGLQPDIQLIPDEMTVLFKDAFTKEYRRNELVRRTRNASPCSALNDWTDKEIWDDMVYQFNLDELETWGNSLDEAIKNALAHDLPLDNWEENYSKPEWSEFEITHGVAWVVLAEELGRCWDQ